MMPVTNIAAPKTISSPTKRSRKKTAIESAASLFGSSSSSSSSIPSTLTTMNTMPTAVTNVPKTVKRSNIEPPSAETLFASTQSHQSDMMPVTNIAAPKTISSPTKRSRKKTAIESAASLFGSGSSSNMSSTTTTTTMASNVPGHFHVANSPAKQRKRSLSQEPPSASALFSSSPSKSIVSNSTTIISPLSISKSEKETSPLPPDWQELVDQTTQKKYYYNRKTDETTWTRPSSSSNEKKRETVRESQLAASLFGSGSSSSSSSVPSTTATNVPGQFPPVTKPTIKLTTITKRRQSTEPPSADALFSSSQQNNTLKPEMPVTSDMGPPMVISKVPTPKRRTSKEPPSADALFASSSFTSAQSKIDLSNNNALFSSSSNKSILSTTVQGPPGADSLFSQSTSSSEFFVFTIHIV